MLVLVVWHSALPSFMAIRKVSSSPEKKLTLAPTCLTAYRKPPKPVSKSVTWGIIILDFWPTQQSLQPTCTGSIPILQARALRQRCITCLRCPAFNSPHYPHGWGGALRCWRKNQVGEDSIVMDKGCQDHKEMPYGMCQRNAAIQLKEDHAQDVDSSPQLELF